MLFKRSRRHRDSLSRIVEIMEYVEQHLGNEPTEKELTDKFGKAGFLLFSRYCLGGSEPYATGTHDKHTLTQVGVRKLHELKRTLSEQHREERIKHTQYIIAGAMVLTAIFYFWSAQLNVISMEPKLELNFDCPYSTDNMTLNLSAVIVNHGDIGTYVEGVLTVENIDLDDLYLDGIKQEPMRGNKLTLGKYFIGGNEEVKILDTKELNTTTTTVEWFKLRLETSCESIEVLPCKMLNREAVCEYVREGEEYIRKQCSYRIF